MRKKWALKVSLMRTIVRGKAIKKKNEITAIARDIFGDEAVGDGSRYTKAFAVCTARLDYKMDPESKTASVPYAPFIARNYEYACVTEACSISSITPLCEHGSSDINIADAIGATAGVPGIARRVRINTTKGAVSLADGGMMCNCPIAIAIDEARRLFPNRPIGVILSLGLDENENHDAQRAADITRQLCYPNLTYQRILIPQSSMVWIGETNKQKVRAMQKEVEDWILKNEYQRIFTRQTIKRIYECSGQSQENNDETNIKICKCSDQSQEKKNDETTEKIYKRSDQSQEEKNHDSTIHRSKDIVRCFFLFICCLVILDCMPLISLFMCSF